MDDQSQLAALVERHAAREGMHPSAIPRLSLIRNAAPYAPVPTVYEACLCLVVQGRKRVFLGDNALEYDSGSFLGVSVDMPVIGQVIEASESRPYLCLCLALDRALLSELALQIGPPQVGDPGPGLFVGGMTDALSSAALRLVSLLDSPGDIPVLAPLAERELLYRLLLGEQGARLRQLAHAESKLSQINRAITWIKNNFRKPFSIEVLSAEARMSASALHQHFKQVTSLSPLQYQKQMRLQEARRLIFAEALDAAHAAFEVGYESPSQFSREYRRLFGAPPMRDVERMRAEEAPIAAAP